MAFPHFSYFLGKLRNWPELQLLRNNLQTEHFAGLEKMLFLAFMLWTQLQFMSFSPFSSFLCIDLVKVVLKYFYAQANESKS